MTCSNLSNIPAISGENFTPGINSEIPSVAQANTGGNSHATTNQRLGLKKGVHLLLVETPDGFLIAPRVVVAEFLMDKVGDELRASGVTLDDWIESGREIRGKLVKERYGLAEEE